MNEVQLCLHVGQQLHNQATKERRKRTKNNSLWHKCMKLSANILNEHVRKVGSASYTEESEHGSPLLLCRIASPLPVINVCGLFR